MTGNLYRLSAFTDTPSGGNPAGVWIGETLPAAEEMQAIAAEMDYSETAFIAPAEGTARAVRFYSPQKEIDFCGHATIASAVMLGRLEDTGTYHLETRVGEVPVEVTESDGQPEAALTSVSTRHHAASDTLVHKVLELLGWNVNDLDTGLPPVKAFAGAWHLILAVNSLSRLQTLSYPFEALKQLMSAEELTTVQLVYRESPRLFHSRNPFPTGGVVEDPATGAAAAALGGYLRDAGLMEVPGRFTVRQGEAMGQPSLINVAVPGSGGVVVRGTAVDIS